MLRDNNSNSKCSNNSNYSNNNKFIICSRYRIFNINKITVFILRNQEAMAMEEFRKVLQLLNIVKIYLLSIIKILIVPFKMVDPIQKELAVEAFQMIVEFLWPYKYNLVNRQMAVDFCQVDQEKIPKLQRLPQGLVHTLKLIIKILKHKLNMIISTAIQTISTSISQQIVTCSRMIYISSIQAFY